MLYSLPLKHNLGVPQPAFADSFDNPGHLASCHCQLTSLCPAVPLSGASADFQGDPLVIDGDPDGHPLGVRRCAELWLSHRHHW